MSNEIAALTRTACMLIGDGGAGKTHSFSTWPMPMEIAAFERGTQCLDNLPSELRSQITVEYFLDDDPMKPTALDRFMRWVGGARGRADKSEFKSFGIDSATSFGEAMMAKLLVETGRTAKDPRWEIEYRMFPWRAKTLMQSIMAMPCHVVMSAHMELFETKDEKGKVVKVDIRPAFVGQKVSKTFNTMFREMYYAYRKYTKGKVERFWLTNMRPQLEWCKTTMGGMGIIEDVVPQDYGALLEKVRKHREGGGSRAEA
jgi:hypothetical protein